MTKDLIIKALKSATKFVAYILPGESRLRFVIDIPEQEAISNQRIYIQPWLADAVPAIIRDTIVPDDFMHLDLPDKEVGEINTSSTDYQQYIDSLARVIKRLGKEGGKVVISRTEVLEDETLDYSKITDAALRIFEASPKAFRYICHTSEFGVWIGATPETLFDYDAQSGTLTTMALAGTLRNEDLTEWDEKNLTEHRLVADYILDCLRDANINAVAELTRTLSLGHIRHLLTPITAHAPGRDAMEIARILHPTPAICGSPKERALQIIAEEETHSRECYGGYIMVTDSERSRAYVNLRCFKFAPGKCCFYAGGGILADSDPTTEWAETSLKIAATRSMIE